MSKFAMPLKIYFSTFAVINLIIFILVGFRSLKLRPISDDYCFAARAVPGTFSALSDWYLTWSGDLFSILLSTVFIGSSILHLPWSISSSIPFLVSGSLIGILIYPFFNRSIIKSRKSLLFLFIFLSVLVANAWWSQWWISSLLNYSDTALVLQNSITFWQTINVAYVMVLIINLVLFFSLEYVSDRYSRLVSVIYGALLGLSGMVYASSIVLLSMLRMTSYCVSRKKISVRLLKIYGLYTFTALLFLGFSFFSPGTQARKSILEESPQLEVFNLISLYYWTFPAAANSWFSSFFNLGSFFSFIIFLCLGFISVNFFGVDIKFRYTYLIFLLFTLSIIMTVISRISEAFAYQAFWHLIPIHLLRFLVIASLSLCLGAVLARKYQNNILTISIILVATAAQILQVYSIYLMGERIEQRYKIWSKGSAPLHGIEDLSLTSTKGTYNMCWDRIGDFRPLPKRN
jgi:hypothetical protein